MKKILMVLVMMACLPAYGRDPAVVDAFRKEYPCPATGRHTGACTGWVVDHSIPLCAGGADAVYNMHWQLVAESYLKDADERKLCARLRKAGL